MPQGRKEFLEQLGRNPADPTAPPITPGNPQMFGSDYLTNFGAGARPPQSGIPTYPLYPGGEHYGADWNAMPRGAALIEGAQTPISSQLPRGQYRTDPYSSNVAPAGQSYYTAAPAPTKGLLVQGNIDPYHRRTLYNPDGSVSTTTSDSTEAARGQYQGKEILVPTVVGGVRMTMDQAMDRFYRTGQHFGIFENGADADAYATWLHWEQVRHGGGY